ncbi:hypothetical protein DFH28DRAFT_861518, partial [Melampsora americana]
KPTHASSSIQTWRYHKEQNWEPDEVYVFMQHDSTAPDGHGINVPHASFAMAKDPPKSSQKSSIECRVIEFLEP